MNQLNSRYQESTSPTKLPSFNDYLEVANFRLNNEGIETLEEIIKVFEPQEVSVLNHESKLFSSFM